ncbi:ft-interacting protein 1 [Quercus suber]|uniref:Ft-interacting protein 1 n=1 Tax=Quercus suber TaxID=58331 RepID=A0AAW0L8T9_QUESU
MEARRRSKLRLGAATLRAHTVRWVVGFSCDSWPEKETTDGQGQSSKKVQGPYDYLDQEEMFPTMPEPPRHGIERDQDFLLMWMHANTTNEDELDEEFDPLPSRKTGEVLKGRYDRLRIIAVRMQTVLGDLATQGERVTYMTPFHYMIVLPGTHVLMHPRLHVNFPPVPQNFLTRMSGKNW